MEVNSGVKKKYTEARSGEVIFLKPLFTEIEKNSCFSIFTLSDVNKIREETVKNYYFIDGSNHAQV